VLAVIIIVAVAVLVARRSGRRSAAAASWRAKVVDVTANGSALYDAMSAAQAPGAPAAGDAGVRWADIQRRGDDLNTELYALREMAPGEAERLQVADVLAALHAVRSAMDAERAAGAAGPPQDARVPGLLQAFEASLRALRSPPGPGDPSEQRRTTGGQSRGVTASSRVGLLTPRRQHQPGTRPDRPAVPALRGAP
jgi:hypothetical protein